VLSRAAIAADAVSVDFPLVESPVRDQSGRVHALIASVATVASVAANNVVAAAERAIVRVGIAQPAPPRGYPPAVRLRPIALSVARG